MPWLRMLSSFGIPNIGFGFSAAGEAICDELFALATIIVDYGPAPQTIVAIAATLVA
jgi:hypothetical protein